MKFLPYACQNIDASDIKAVTDALQQDIITRGPTVSAFEEAVAKQVGATYAVAFSSGSSAFLAAFHAVHITPYDCVITSANTFIASIAGAIQQKAKVFLLDIDAYGNMQVEMVARVANQFRSRGRSVIVPVHFAGVAMDMRQLARSVTFPRTVIIEDGAHAFGSLYPDGSMVGSCRYSDMTVFSFHAIKNITCAEGGMVTTNDRSLYDRLSTLRNSGIEREQLEHATQPEPWYYEVKELGCNFHMTELQAALGISQLRKLDQFREQKHQLVIWYRERLDGIPGVQLPPDDVDARTHYHLWPIHIEFEALGLTRTSVMQKLREASVGSQYHYVPLYMHPIVSSVCSQSSEEFPMMERYKETALSVPFFSKMQEVDVDHVVKALRHALLHPSHS